MNIIHVAKIINAKASGIKTVLHSLIPEQISLSNNVYLFNIYNNESKENYEYYILDYSSFKDLLEQFNPDIVIFHNIYQLKFYKMAFYLNRNSIPYLIMPHGGTSSINHKRSFIKKSLVDLFFVNRFVINSQGLIYLNKSEKELCFFKNKRKKYTIIPNGVNMPINVKSINCNQIIKIIYLSRIHYKPKGLDLLLAAWESVVQDCDNIELHIYGNYVSSTDRELFENAISKIHNVYYHGMVTGNLKEQAYLDSDIYILLSRNEGMPMSVLEALSYGLPCIITPTTNMSDIIKYNASGWICELNIESVYRTISKAVIEKIKLT